MQRRRWILHGELDVRWLVLPRLHWTSATGTCCFGRFERNHWTFQPALTRLRGVAGVRESACADPGYPFGTPCLRFCCAALSRSYAYSRVVQWLDWCPHSSARLCLKSSLLIIHTYWYMCIISDRGFWGFGMGGFWWAAPPPRAYPACLLRSHAPLSSGTKGAEVVCVRPRASPCGLAPLVRVPLTLARRGTGMVCVAGFLPAQE